jgi:NADPH-dependent F420 reductase
MTTQPLDLPDASEVRIGILGGTGEQGRGLARRFAMAGHAVTLGSRDASRAQQLAGEVASTIKGGSTLLSGASNDECARGSDVVIIAVPWDGHLALVTSLREALAGTIVVDCVNPLGFDKQGAFGLSVPEGSAAQQAAEVLQESTVVGAFHHVSAVLLLDEDVDTIDTDVLVLGDVREATDLVQALASEIPGMRGVYGGRLRNCGQVEAMTANLISMNRRYKAHAGLRVTDV